MWNFLILYNSEYYCFSLYLSLNILSNSRFSVCRFSTSCWQEALQRSLLPCYFFSSSWSKDFGPPCSININTDAHRHIKTRTWRYGKFKKMETQIYIKRYNIVYAYIYFFYIAHQAIVIIIIFAKSEKNNININYKNS